jgi:hypothetical protein
MNMDHLEAKEMHAAEKYVLEELTDELREGYEEHYMDCSECALDVQAMVAFVANSKEVLREQRQRMPIVQERRQESPRSAGWLKALIAVPAMAALIVTLIYERHQLKTPAIISPGPAQMQVVSASFGLRGGDRAAREATKVQVHAGEAFGLHFDFTPGQTFPQYNAELQDSSGRTIHQFPISAERINKEVKLVVPGAFAAPGNFVLVIYGNAAGAAERSEVGRFSFTIGIIP